METSPIPPEWSGTPEIMFILDTTISSDHDFAQSQLLGATRVRFLHLIENHFKDWYITPLVKCKPRGTSYLVGDYKICTGWITEEIKRVSPKIIIGCGSKVKKYIDCDFETMSPVRITQSKKHEQMFELLLQSAKAELEIRKTMQIPGVDNWL